VNNPKLTFEVEPALEAELARFREQRALLDRTELIAHIGHYEWSYQLDCLLACSEEYARIHDMSVKEVLRAHDSLEGFMRQIHPDDVDSFEQASETLRREHAVDRVYRLRCQSGEIRYIRECAVEVIDDQGDAIGAFGILQDISDTVRYERDLEYRDELARQSEALTDIGHFIYDEENQHYVYVSDGLARIYGTTAEGYMRDVSSFEDDLADILPEDRERVAQAYLACIDNGKDCVLEFRIRRDDGSVRWLRELTCAKKTRDGRVIQTLGAVQDITQRKQAESELLFKDELANQAEALTDIGHFVFDERDERYVYVSEGYARIYGSSADAFKGQKCRVSDYLSGIFVEDRERVAAEYRRFVEDGNDCALEYRIVRPDGSIRWLRELSRARIVHDGKVRETLGVIQDITPQKSIEQELLYKDELASQAEAITEIGHFIFDQVSETYSYLSPGFARIHGLSVEEYKSTVNSRNDDIDDLHAEDYERVLAAYNRHRQMGEDLNIEYRIYRSDGAIRWIREQVTLVRGPGGEPRQSIGVIQDITEQKNTEKHLREARDSLEQMVKNRTRKLAETVRQLQAEIKEREKVSAELAFLANHDALTGLPSLRLCKDRLDHSLAEARRKRQLSSVMFLDLDGFKEVNDAHGHEFGDRVLKTIAERITEEIRETDTVARIGGDEFVIISSGLPDRSIAERIATSLIRHISQPVSIEADEVAVSASIGIAFYPGDGDTAEELIRSADQAMYWVKHRGKNNFGFAGSRES
jgi:diguanylate cyclase (GGDEF)-like protein/PAS domain S-box-containing protein